MKNRRAKRRNANLLAAGCLFIFLLVIVVSIGSFFLVPVMAEQMLGPISDSLDLFQRFQYSALMLWYDGMVTSPVDSSAGEITFIISEGDNAVMVAQRLEEQGIIRSADAFTAYLVYSGLDTGLQVGEFNISPAMAPIQIAQKLQDATPTQVKFVILPGWRLEEVAASLPTSGLDISPEEFMAAVRTPARSYDFLPAGASAEGFLLPGEYILPRTIQVEQLVELLMNNSALALTMELRNGFARQNLSVYQAVTLASIIQREAVMPDEQPIIASVFLNRMASGMKLETDPTVQYALGFNGMLNTWWKAPLSSDDLTVQSPYNTYIIPALPPAPISNPSISALQAVAYPAQTTYFFFRARCDGSGLHNFSETFEEHLQNGCQ